MEPRARNRKPAGEASGSVYHLSLSKPWRSRILGDRRVWTCRSGSGEAAAPPVAERVADNLDRQFAQPSRVKLATECEQLVLHGKAVVL